MLDPVRCRITRNLADLRFSFCYRWLWLVDCTFEGCFSVWVWRFVECKSGSTWWIPAECLVAVGQNRRMANLKGHPSPHSRCSIGVPTPTRRSSARFKATDTKGGAQSVADRSDLWSAREGSRKGRSRSIVDGGSPAIAYTRTYGSCFRKLQRGEVDRRVCGQRPRLCAR